MTSIHTRKTFIVDFEYGGLGDSLFFSHLPRIAKQFGGYDQVLVSNGIPFRNPEYKEIIWRLNPFVDGFCDDRVPPPAFAEVEPGMNLLDKHMLFHGMDDGQRYHKPEIYYQPQRLPEIVGKTVYDPNWISNVGSLRSEDIACFFVEENIHVHYQMKLRDKSLPIEGFDETLAAKSLAHFCDIIHSSASLYCPVSGTATLASALSKPSVVFYTKEQNPMFRHWRQHNYVQLREDYKLPAPKPRVARLLSAIKRRIVKS